MMFSNIFLLYESDLKTLLTGRQYKEYNIKLIVMYTPNKYMKQLTLSDFQFTHNVQNSGTLEKKDKVYDYDNMSTPKKMNIYASLGDRLLRKHQFRYLRNNRARLIDWYLQIHSSYQMGWSSFWSCVELIDTLIAEFDYINLNNVHLVGITCCFTVAKYMGLSQFKLKHAVVGLGHSKFTESQIIREEESILKMIFERSNFQRRTVYAYLIERFGNYDRETLKRALKQLTIAFMRPQMTFQRMNVSTYVELIHTVMLHISLDRPISVLAQVETEMIDKYGGLNIETYGNSIEI